LLVIFNDEKQIITFEPATRTQRTIRNCSSKTVRLQLWNTVDNSSFPSRIFKLGNRVKE
jgi:hypothetical protein